MTIICDSRIYFMAVYCGLYVQHIQSNKQHKGLPVVSEKDRDSWRSNITRRRHHHHRRSLDWSALPIHLTTPLSKPPSFVANRILCVLISFAAANVNVLAPNITFFSI